MNVFGVVVGGVMLMVFALIQCRRIAEVSLQSLDLFRLFRGLRCGVLFWLSKPLVLFILVLTIWGCSSC